MSLAIQITFLRCTFVNQLENEREYTMAVTGAYKACIKEYAKIQYRLIDKVTIIYEEKSVEVDALWDTGASCSCVSHDVVDSLGLISIGKRNITTPSGKKTYDTFNVNVALPNHLLCEDVIVNDSEIGDQGLGMLVGMDIITRGDFCVSNFNGKTSFTFRVPSQERTDYVLKSKVSKVVGSQHGKGNRKRKR